MNKQQQVMHNQQSVFYFMLIHIQLLLFSCAKQSKTSYSFLYKLA